MKNLLRAVWAAVCLLLSGGSLKVEHHGECPRCGALFGSPGLDRCPSCQASLQWKAQFREYLVTKIAHEAGLDFRYQHNVEYAEKWADGVIAKLEELRG